MKLNFPSREFDDVVAAVCHGEITEEQARAVNELLRSDAVARDEYLLRVELHSRLASSPDLYPNHPAHQPEETVGTRTDSERFPVPKAKRSWRSRKRRGVLAGAICLLLLVLVAGWWGRSHWSPVESTAGQEGVTSMAVAMLDRALDAKWGEVGGKPQIGGALEPEVLHLQSGMVQVVFYSGARVVIEGPAEFELINQEELMMRTGRLTVEVPSQAVGFRVTTPTARVTDLGTAFGLEVTQDATELHVFEGEVELEQVSGGVVRQLEAGAAALVKAAARPRPIVIDAWKFAPLFELQRRSIAAQASRYDRWRVAGEQLNHDPSLLVRLDFEESAIDDWRLLNACALRSSGSVGTVVGCQWTHGRWPGKRALEFQNINDRVRLNVPGEFDSLTIALWVRVQGLDRRINSLFMSDGFAPGTIHWSIRNDGVLAMTTIGGGFGNFKLATTPSAISLDQFGRWLHLAVVIDGSDRTVTQYVNGRVVGSALPAVAPPYLVGAAELGNWNPQGFPERDPFHIRNFGGAMDEFCLFSRALSDEEIEQLYQDGNPQPAPVARR